METVIAPAPPDAPTGIGAAADAARGLPPGGSRSPRPRRISAQRLTAGVLALGLVVTAALFATTRAAHNSNEKRLLKQRVREAATLLTTALPQVQTPLASAAALAETNHASPDSFRRILEPFVGTNKQFVSASLWSQRAAKPLILLGPDPLFDSSSVDARQVFFERALRQPRLTVLDLLNASPPSIGYAYAQRSNAHYIVYAESRLPRNRRLAIDRNSAFGGLDYALYLGSTRDPRHLVATSLDRLPVTGRYAVAPAPFGDATFELVGSARGELGGALLQRLPWFVLAVGIALTLGAAGMTERLLRRRRQSEQLARDLDEIASENRRLYARQRTIAQTLQHALLPEVPSRVGGVEVAARYVPGVKDVDIAGDWYDVVELGPRRMLLVVGDVSGRGLRAASVMASLRFASRAYALQGDPPEVLLEKLAQVVDLGRDGHFATMFCASIDLDTATMRVVNAGHPPALLVVSASASFLTTEVGTPVGVPTSTPYVAATIDLPPAGTLLAFTDGLVERRGETLDRGFERVRAAAECETETVEGLVSTLLEHMTPQGSDDDIAIVGVRWRT